MNESKRKFIVRKQTQQRANGKDCTFRVWGRTVEPEKISRWQKRDNDADKLLVSGTTVPSRRFGPHHVFQYPLADRSLSCCVDSI